MNIDFKKRIYSFVSFFLILILLISCQATTEEFPVVVTQTSEQVTVSTPPEPGSETGPIVTPTPRPTISVDHKTLKGLTMTVLHPFAENEDLFNQMIRDFNLYNIWGIHVVGGISYPGGYQALSHNLQSGKLEVDMVIGMTKYLQAAGVPYEWIDLGNYANDPKYGVQELYDPDGGVFVSLLPDFESDILPDLPLAYNAGLIYYNVDWAEALGEKNDPIRSGKLARDCQ